MPSTNTKLNNAICPLAGKCGGCQLQNLSYPDQLRMKHRELIRLLGKFGAVPPVIGMDNPLHYRHKVQAAFGVSKNGKPICGVFQSSSHRIVPSENCMIEDQDANEIIQFIKSSIGSFHIMPYDIRSGNGHLRHVLIRKSYNSGRFMVVLVTASGILPGSRNFAKFLANRFPSIETIVQNINEADTSLVLGKQEKVLFGTGYLLDSILGKSFAISPRSFYQVNPRQTEVLYSLALQFADLSGHETVVDAYCGTGTIGLIASDKAGTVLGIELNSDAVRDAKANAKRNDVSNISFICSDSGKYLLKMSSSPHPAPIDILFTDPPRAGCSMEFLNSVIAVSPDRIVYISCNPMTLKRDLNVLTQSAYRVARIQSVDMFPYTNHVESVVLMSRAGS